jgi:hypothetical protein
MHKRIRTSLRRSASWLRGRSCLSNDLNDGVVDKSNLGLMNKRKLLLYKGSVSFLCTQNKVCCASAFSDCRWLNAPASEVTRRVYSLSSPRYHIPISYASANSQKMDSDEEMHDVEMSSLPSFAKGKGKAIDKGNNDYNDNLPWCVFESTTGLSLKVSQGREISTGDTRRRCVSQRHHEHK